MGCLAMLTQTLQDRGVLFIPLSFALLLTGGRLWYRILCRLTLLYISGWPYGFSTLPTPYGFLTGLLDKYNPKKPRCDRIRGLKEEVAKHRLIVRFALVEFQEALCFFMIAIQIASILALTTSADFFDTGSFLQLARNTLTTRCVSLGANVSVTSGLWLLYKLDMKSWYTSLCSSIAVALSIVTFYVSSN